MPTDQEFIEGNRTVIEEFRSNAGIVAALGYPILLLTTTGARTGRRVTTPLGYGVDSGRVFVVASKGGAPQHPTWFYNVTANPNVTVELGRSCYEADAKVTSGRERDHLFEVLATDAPQLREFQQGASRVIPVIVLEGVPAPSSAGLGVSGGSV